VIIISSDTASGNILVNTASQELRTSSLEVESN